MQASDSEIQSRIAPFLDKPGPRKWSVRPIQSAAIWNFCEAVEDANPVYWDPDAAAASRFGRLIAPPQALMSLNMDPWWLPPALREKHAAAEAERANSPQMQARDVLKEYGFETVTVVSREEEYLTPFGPGDGRMGQDDRVVSVSNVKNTKVGQGVFFTYQIDYVVEKVPTTVVARATTVTLIYRAEKAGS